MQQAQKQGAENPESGQGIARKLVTLAFIGAAQPRPGVKSLYLPKENCWNCGNRIAGI